MNNFCIKNSFKYLKLNLSRTSKFIKKKESTSFMIIGFEYFHFNGYACYFFYHIDKKKKKLLIDEQENKLQQNLNGV